MTPFLELKNEAFYSWQEKESIFEYMHHHLSTLRKAHDVEKRSSGRMFLSHPHTYDKFL